MSSIETQLKDARRGARTIPRVQVPGSQCSHGAPKTVVGATNRVPDGPRRPVAGGARRGEDRLRPRRGGYRQAQRFELDENGL